MARPSNTDERRAQIVDGLQRVMAGTSYEGATIAEIAQAASMTPGLVHYHFESKQEILLALVQKLARLWRERAAAKSGTDDDSPRARVEVLIDAWLALDDRADPGAVACWVALGAEAVRQPPVRELYVAAVREAAAAIEDAVREALKDEGRATAQSKAIATGLMAAIEGYLQLGLLGNDIVPRSSAARTLRAMAMGVLDAQPLASRKGG